MLKLLDAVTSTTSNSGTNLVNETGLINDGQMRFQVVISGVATVVIYVSNDNVNWKSISTHTASGIYSGIIWPYVKADVTVFTTGNATCTVVI